MSLIIKDFFFQIWIIIKCDSKLTKRIGCQINHDINHRMHTFYIKALFGTLYLYSSHNYSWVNILLNMPERYDSFIILRHLHMFVKSRSNGFDIWRYANSKNNCCFTFTYVWLDMSFLKENWPTFPGHKWLMLNVNLWHRWLP